MSKIYYVDSENVGDSWVDLACESKDSQFLIFYTGHSPRIDYDHLVRIIDVKDKLKFIRCNEGNNALDFQLVSFLGYRLHSDLMADLPNESVIVSNDTGFDAVIDFWTERGMRIERLATNLPHASETKEEQPVSSDDVANHQIVDLNAKVQGVGRKELCTITNCLGAENTSYIHLAFVHFYGNKKGEAIYKTVKAEKFIAPAVNWKKETKMKRFCDLIFAYCNPANTPVPEDLSAFLCSVVNSSDDKKSMKKKMEKKYGSKIAPVNKILSPFYKAITKITE